jgi:hypothetical protein
MNRTALRSVLLLSAVCAASFGDTLVVPNNQATAPGNLAIPVGAGASRFQEIVGSGQFAQPLVITGIRVRSAPGSGPVSYTYTSLKITLSTTPAYPNTLNGHTLPSTTYASNVGPDATTVFNAPFSASSPGCAAPGPCPFDIAISLTTPFSFDPSKGRLLVDIVTSATNGAPTGSLDGVAFPDSSSSSVATLSGDPTQATGSASLGGLVLGLLGGAQVSTSLSGSFGYLIYISPAPTTVDSGTGLLGVMNFDGAGNVTGSYNFQRGSTSTKAAQTGAGSLTGTYSSNPNGTGSVKIALDAGLTVTFAMVITDGGQGLQLVGTNLIGGDVSGEVITGVARAAYVGLLTGSYGFQLNNSPIPAGTIGVADFDGAGNVTVSFTSVGVGTDPSQPPVMSGTLTGTYSTNPDGSGTMNFPAQSGQSGNSAFAFVITDSGSGALLLLTTGTGSNVTSGTARLQ